MGYADKYFKKNTAQDHLAMALALAEAIEAVQKARKLIDSTPYKYHSRTQEPSRALSQLLQAVQTLDRQAWDEARDWSSEDIELFRDVNPYQVMLKGQPAWQ